jgi:hypothetical protein
MVNPKFVKFNKNNVGLTVHTADLDPDASPKSNKPSLLAHHNLLNANNYKEEIQYDKHTILDKCALLITEYFMYLDEKVNIKNKVYFNYILLRGLDTIMHVFDGMMFYTKNVDLAFYHSQKAFYYYVEFIEQIMDTQNSFLKLSSRDASLFVYKRTLYEVNTEYIKPSLQPDALVSTMKCLNVYCRIYKMVVHYFINEHLAIEYKTEQIGHFTNKLTKLSSKLNYLIMDDTTLQKLCDHLTINSLTNTSSPAKYKQIDDYFDSIDAVIKKIAKGQQADW